MTSSGQDRRRVAPLVLFALAAAAALLGAVLEWTGGFSFNIRGVRLSAHGSLRPILAGVLAAAWGFRLLDDSVQDAAIARIVRVARRFILLVPWVAAAAILAAGIAYGTRAAGGSDPYGYISQARLWRAGDLRVQQDFVASIPWPNADWTFTPLGYRPSEGHTLVPTYAPGLPLLMALFATVAGACGPYIVNPVCAALLVLLTYAIGAHLSGRAVGAMAALLVASSPTVLLLTLWPMSDVPAAMFWTASLLLACRTAVPRASNALTNATAAASGAAAGMAIAIRPNLVPLALFPVLIAVWPILRTVRRVRLQPDPVPPSVRRGVRLQQDPVPHQRDLGRSFSVRTALMRTAAFGAGCLPFVLLVASFYDRLYGSPVQSGYGDTGTLFAWHHLPRNLIRYPRWLWDTQGPLVFLFFLAPWLPTGSVPSRRWLRLVFLAFTGTVLASYLWYIPFEPWWFLRFLLPALPVIFVLAADVVWHGSLRFGTRTRVLATIAFTCIMLDYAATRTRERDVLQIGTQEQKYADVGRYIARRLPPNAVVITMQHSGSVRYYAGRPTLRYDMLDADWLDRALAHLRSSGYEPYVLLEGFEVALFKKRFRGESAVAIVDRAPAARHAPGGVMLYRTDGTNAPREPELIPVTSGCW